MSYAAFRHHRAGKVAGRVLLFGVSCLLAVCTWAAPVGKGGARSSYVSDGKPDPEQLLAEVYKDLGENNLRQAMAKADKLVEAYPNFRLGHLIRGDLLQMYTRPVTTLGAVDGPAEKLKNLREEAMVRLKSLRDRPDPDLLPRLVLQLRDDQKTVLLVDAKRSRLYVYANRAGQLSLVSDYYVSQGKYGVNKFREGDQRTPIGIYYITSRLPGERLPDFYGSGALPINYPNEWDKINGRSGSGIWLHGTPSDSYSRPPLSSDGCVVLNNRDLHTLSNTVEVGKTPVLISESIEFVNKTKWENDRKLASRLLDEWRRDFESMNQERLSNNYSKRFRSDRGESLEVWLDKQKRSVRGVKELTVSLRDVSHFIYPGRNDMIVTTFTQEAEIGKSRSTIRKRQYWEKEGAQWKIVYELNLQGL